MRVMKEKKSRARITTKNQKMLGSFGFSLEFLNPSYVLPPTSNPILC